MKCASLERIPVQLQSFFCAGWTQQSLRSELTAEGIPAARDSKHMEWSDDERLFPLKLFALCPKAIGFDGGGVRSSVGQNKAGALSVGRILQYERTNQLQ